MAVVCSGGDRGLRRFLGQELIEWRRLDGGAGRGFEHSAGRGLDGGAGRGFDRSA
jgi:hypothetical protein